MQCLLNRNCHGWPLLVSLWLGPLCAAIILACGLTAVAHSVSGTRVTTTDDSGAGSLRQAITNVVDGGTIVFDAVVFSVPQTITLNSQLVFSKNLTIDGAAGGVVTPTISGPGAACGTCFRVFNITGGEVTLRRLAIVNGKVGAPQFGGGINSSGNLTVANSLITGNVASMNGGGIAVNAPSFLTLIDTAVMSNVANGFGGGVYANANASVAGSWFQGNTGLMGGGLSVLGSLWTTATRYVSNTATLNFGGGLYAGGELHMTGTQFIGNVAAQNHGGGVYANSAVYGSNVLFQANRGSWGGGLRANGSVALTATQFLTNTATAFGGAACVNGAVDIVDAKFVGNRAAIGGGLYFSAASAGQVANALFARNSANSSGAAISLNGNGANGPITLVHTTVASPTVGTGPALYVGGGIVLITDTIVASYTTGISQTSGSVASEYNLFYNAPTTVTIGIHSIAGVDPHFVDPTADDYHLVSGSPAVGSGVDVGIAYDLDGIARRIAPTIGAYEGLLGPRPALAISVQPLTEVAYQAPVTYTLALSNTGDEIDASALMTDHLPTGIAFAQWVEQPPGAVQAGNTITWAGSLAVGAPITVTFAATNTARGGTTITNTAWFSGALRAGHAAVAFTAMEQPPPVAVNDAAGTLQGVPVTLLVLANDRDLAGGGLTVAAITLQPAHGAVQIAGDGKTVLYTPAADFSGQDSFVYTVADVNGNGDDALVTILVTAQNQTDAPPQIAPVDPEVDASKQFTSPAAGVEVELSGGFYTDTLTEKEILFLSYTPIVTPTTPTHTPPGNLKFGNFEFDLTLIRDNEPQHGVQFAVPLTVTIAYDPELLNGLREDLLDIYFWDGAAWVKDGITVLWRDPINHTITFLLAHLSHFGFFSNQPTGSDLAPEPQLAPRLYLPRVLFDQQAAGTVVGATWPDGQAPKHAGEPDSRIDAAILIYLPSLNR